MADMYMGQPELPTNSPRPAETPPDGVIVTDATPDGWTRRYVYKSYMGQVEETLIDEIPPRMSGDAQVVDGGARPRDGTCGPGRPADARASRHARSGAAASHG